MESHLLQMRGLKLKPLQPQYITCESHLLQMRGLKQIERMGLYSKWCRIFYRCVD